MYDEFYASISTLIMGGKTYRQVANELSPDSWPYAGKKCFVYTKTPFEPTDEVEATALPPAELLADIRRPSEEDIWLMGGVPFFPAEFPLTALSLESTQKVGGMVELIYNKRP